MRAGVGGWWGGGAAKRERTQQAAPRRGWWCALPFARTRASPRLPPAPRSLARPPLLITGFPTLKWFGEDKERPEDYQGGRDTPSLAAFANERWGRVQPPPEVRELTDEQTWEEHCVGHAADEELELKEVKPKQLCIVAFLPHILDSKAEGREAYIKVGREWGVGGWAHAALQGATLPPARAARPSPHSTRPPPPPPPPTHTQILKALTVKFKERPFSYFWAEGGAQSALESNFGVGGYGYPALIALNPAKGKFASLRSAFEDAHVNEFLDNVRVVSGPGRRARAGVLAASSVQRCPSEPACSRRSLSPLPFTSLPSPFTLPAPPGL